jgi:hypothetical protein
MTDNKIIRQFTDSGVIEAGIETTAGTEAVRLYADDGQGITFPDMQTLADFVGGAVGLVNGWRADNDFDNLEGVRKQVAAGLTAEFKRQIALKNPELAETFPNDALFGGQWYIDVRHASDPGKIQISIEQHIKALIVSIANVFAAAREAA